MTSTLQPNAGPAALAEPAGDAPQTDDATAPRRPVTGVDEEGRRRTRPSSG